MQSTRPLKDHVKNLSSAKQFEDNESSNEATIETPCECPGSEGSALSSLKNAKYYPRGSVLFAEGQQPRGVHVLCEGRAKVSITSSQGKTLVLRIAHPGDLLGMNATLTGEPYGATVETLVRCRVEFIAREDVLKLLDRDRAACLSVAHALSRKLSGVVAHARLLFLSQSASEKLATLLVSWCDEYGKRTARGIRISPGLTHEEMAQMICSSRETVTRVLGEFKRENIVSLADKAIFVHNREALELLACC